jgi:hypothetical protein
LVNKELGTRHNTVFVGVLLGFRGQELRRILTRFRYGFGAILLVRSSANA